MGSSDSSDQDSIKKSKIHASEDHLSYKEHENVEPHQYVATDEPTQFPAPDERNVKTAPKKNAAAKTVSQQSAFAAQNLEDLAIYDAQGEKCCECNRSMTQQGHYVAYLCCTKCRYSSCCAKAMSEHVKIFHSGGPPVFDLGKSVILKEPMYCVCGYSAHSGMKLAKHIVEVVAKQPTQPFRRPTKLKWIVTVLAEELLQKKVPVGLLLMWMTKVVEILLQPKVWKMVPPLSQWKKIRKKRGRTRRKMPLLQLKQR